MDLSRCTSCVLWLRLQRGLDEGSARLRQAWQPIQHKLGLLAFEQAVAELRQRLPSEPAWWPGRRRHRRVRRLVERLAQG